MDEYHVMGANGMRGVQNELKKRAAEGWRLHTAYQETSGGFFGFAGRRHVLIFIKAEAAAAPVAQRQVREPVAPPTQPEREAVAPSSPAQPEREAAPIPAPEDAPVADEPTVGPFVRRTPGGS